MVPSMGFSHQTFSEWRNNFTLRSFRTWRESSAHLFSKTLKDFFFFLPPLCHGCVDSQPHTPVSLRWCRVLCHQRESILLLMKQKMKRSLQLLITDCREPFVIVSRQNTGTLCLITSAWLWHYICRGTLVIWESKKKGILWMWVLFCFFCFFSCGPIFFEKLPLLLIMHQTGVRAIKYAVSFTGRHNKY